MKPNRIAAAVAWTAFFVLASLAGADMELWWDDFEDGNTNCWTISFVSGVTVAVDDTLGNSGNRSIRVWGANSDLGASATVTSRSISVDLDRDYTVRFAFRYDSFHATRFLLFGHIRLMLLDPDEPLLYDPVGDGSFAGNELGNSFESYLWEKEWGWITVRCRPSELEYDLFINGAHVGTVIYQASVAPTATLRFTDDVWAGCYLKAWFDDFSVAGMHDPAQVSFARPRWGSDPENNCFVWADPPDVPFHGQYNPNDVWPVVAELCAPNAPNGRCLVACLEMIFERFGDDLPVPSQNPPVNPGPQEEIEAAANTNDRVNFPNGTWDGTYPSDIRRAGHFSSSNMALTDINVACPPAGPFCAPLQFGYSWRDLGYSVVDTVWTDLAPEDEDSVAAGRPPRVLESLLASGYPIIALFAPGDDYTDSLENDISDGIRDTIAIDSLIEQDEDVVGHAVVLFGYDNVGLQGGNPRNTPSFLLHDPAGGKYQWIPIDAFWNDQWGDKRFVFAAPWETLLLTPPRWKHQCRFLGSLLAGYTGPPPLDGFYPVTNVRGFMDLQGMAIQPGEFFYHDIPGISRTGDFGFSTWRLMGGPKPPPLMIVLGAIRSSAFGTLSPSLSSVSYQIYDDRIGGEYYEGQWLGSGGCFRAHDPGHFGWPYGDRWWLAGRGSSGITRQGDGTSADLFVHIRNLGELPIPAGTMCELSCSDPTLAPRGPGGVYIGTAPVPPLAPGDTATVGPVPWVPPPANGFGEATFTIHSRIDCPADPDSSVWPQDDNNHAAHGDHHFNAVRGVPVTTRFWMENPEPTAMEIVLETEKNGEAREWTVLLDQPVGTPIVMDPFEAVPVEASVTVPANDLDTAGTIYVDASLYTPGGVPVRLTGGVAMTLHLSVNTAVGPPEAPPRFILRPNVPNPFNPATTIGYSISREGRTELRVYSVTGRLVRTLADGMAPAGDHKLIWRGENDRGNPVASGVYFVRLVHDGDPKATRKVLLLR